MVSWKREWEMWCIFYRSWCSADILRKILFVTILGVIQVGGDRMIPNKRHLYNIRFGNSSFINVCNKKTIQNLIVQNSQVYTIKYKFGRFRVYQVSTHQSEGYLILWLKSGGHTPCITAPHDG